jgi:hypothetical protein
MRRVQPAQTAVKSNGGGITTDAIKKAPEAETENSGLSGTYWIAITLISLQASMGCIVQRRRTDK